MQRRRAAFFVAIMLALAVAAERRPLISVTLPDDSPVTTAQPAAQATLDLGVVGLSLLLHWNRAR